MFSEVLAANEEGTGSKGSGSGNARRYQPTTDVDFGEGEVSSCLLGVMWREF